MAKKLELTGQINIISGGNQVTFYFDKLDSKGPGNNPGPIQYSANLGLEIWQKFGTKPVKITVEPADNWPTD